MANFWVAGGKVENVEQSLVDDDDYKFGSTSVESFDLTVAPLAANWTIMPPLERRRAFPKCILVIVGKTLYAVGGEEFPSNKNQKISIEKMNPHSFEWKVITDVRKDRFGISVI